MAVLLQQGHSQSAVARLLGVSEGARCGITASVGRRALPTGGYPCTNVVPHQTIHLPDREFNPDYERRVIPTELYVPERY